MLDSLEEATPSCSLINQIDQLNQPTNQQATQPINQSNLQDALMLDSLEEAQQLCTMHGYETGMQGGAPVALLFKVCDFAMGCLQMCANLNE